MKDDASILWVGPVLSEEELIKSQYSSFAGNKWQSSFIGGLRNKKYKVIVVSYDINRYFNPLYSAKQAESIDRISLSYINIPFVREIHLAVKILLIALSNRCDKIIVYNPYLQNIALVFLSLMRKNIFLIIADPCIKIRDLGSYWLAYKFKVPAIFLAWSQYEKYRGKKLYIDSGFSKYENKIVDLSTDRIVMYTGRIDDKMGIEKIMMAFESISGAKFVISGKNYSSIEFSKYTNSYYLGTLKNEDLAIHMSAAAIFINPQDPSFTENHVNFPSKLYDYIATRKPIISTITSGMSPAIIDLVIPLKSLDLDEIANTINRVISNYDAIAEKSFFTSEKYIRDHLWESQIERYLEWSKL